MRSSSPTPTTTALATKECPKIKDAMAKVALTRTQAHSSSRIKTNMKDSSTWAAKKASASTPGPMAPLIKEISKMGKLKEEVSPYFPGKFTCTNGDIYEGTWSQGLKNGEGTLYYKSGARYEGDFHEGKRHGRGKYYWANSKVYYEGEFFNG